MFNTAMSELKWKIKDHLPVVAPNFELYLPQTMRAFTQDQQELKTVSHHCQTLTPLVKQAIMDQGRTPQVMAVAIVYIAWLGVPNEDNPIFLERLVQSLNLSVYTVSDRAREIKELMRSRLSETDLFTHVKSTKSPLFNRMIPMMLEQLETLPQSSNTQPPVFKQSKRKRERTLQRIQDAKRRIRFQESGLDTSDIVKDPRDFILEEWIKQGWKEEDICNFRLHIKKA